MSAARHSFGEALQARNDRAGWFSTLRQEAFARFEAAGFPTTKDEEWKYTSLGPIAEVAFAVPDMGRFADVGVPKVERVAPASLGARLVFVDGWFAPHLSSVEALPVGATVRALSTAPQGLVGRHLSQVAGFERPFCALNAALFEDGAVLHLAKGTVVERPVHFVYLSTAFERPTAAHPRNLVIAEENSQATVVEVYEGEGAYLTNAVTEVAVGEGAHVRHVKLQNESARGFHLGALYVRQAEDSRFTSQLVQVGGVLARSETRIELAGSGAECELDGLFMPRERQHLDCLTFVDHAVPHCQSRQLYKGVLSDQARGVFYGRVRVRPDAQKTDAAQKNQNLLLSEGAHVDTRPQLEILADDVKCTHGAAVGQLDEDAVFYLRARGLPLPLAQSVLTFAFAAQMVSRLAVEPLRERVRALVTARLPQGEKLGAMS